MSIFDSAVKELLGDVPEPEAMTIGEAANLLGMTQRAIRFYEKSDLINPRRSGRYRIYGSQDIARLRIVKLMRDVEIEVAEIQVFFKRLEAIGTKDQLCELVQNLLDAQAKKLQNQILRCETAYATCKSMCDSLSMARPGN